MFELKDVRQGVTQSKTPGRQQPRIEDAALLYRSTEQLLNGTLHTSTTHA